MTTKKIVAPKYPRLVVSAKRHVKLAREARKQGLHISELVEKIFVSAGKKK